MPPATVFGTGLEGAPGRCPARAEPVGRINVPSALPSDRFGTMERMVIGYARVSTDGQDESLQIDALKAAGCERIYVDRASGAIRERPELTNALRDLRDGEDVLVVWRLDRIGRSLRHLVDLVGDLRSRRIGFSCRSGRSDSGPFSRSRKRLA